MDIKKLDKPIYVDDFALVRLKEMGNIIEIMYSEKRSRGGYITKIDKEAKKAFFENGDNCLISRTKYRGLLEALKK